MSNEDCCGIDIAKSKFDCAIRLENGKYKDKVFKNDVSGFVSFISWITEQNIKNLHVCMEATGIYWEALAEYLIHRGFTVSVVNPAQIKAFSMSLLIREKTDCGDARVINDFCFERQPAVWQLPSVEEQKLRALVLKLESLQKMRTQESNRIQVARTNVIKNIKEHIVWLDNEIATLLKEIQLYINRNIEMKNMKKFWKVFQD
ncbi:hypothetical protein DQY68_16360 [Salmonella enterica subsp. salamae]|nr:hypothetical protein [Salmonella enterica subsp. salamae]